MRKRRVVGRIYGTKYSWKGHKDRNRHKNRVQRSGQARLIYVMDINRNIPTTGRWAGRMKEVGFPLLKFHCRGINGFLFELEVGQSIALHASPTAWYMLFRFIHLHFPWLLHNTQRDAVSRPANQPCLWDLINSVSPPCLWESRGRIKNFNKL